MDTLTKLYENTVRFVLNIDKETPVEILYDSDGDVWDCMLESGYLVLDGELIRTAYRYLLKYPQATLHID